MKKENYYKFMYILSAILVVGFVIILVVDYLKYNPLATSAPFYANILVRIIEFILPSIIILIVGLFCKKKFNR